MALKHKTIPPGTDRPGFAGVTPSLYAEEHLFSGGTQGAVLVKNSLNSDGSAWVPTINGVLIATSTNGIPSFSATLPNAVQDNITRLGTIVSGTWTGGVIALNKGGTNAALTAVQGGIAYSSATAIAFSAVGSTGQVFQSAGTGVPVWSTATYPGTATTTGAYLRASGTNWITSTLILPNAATANRIVYATATNTYGESAGITYNGTVFSVTTAGTHVFTGASAASNRIQVENTTSGTGASASQQWTAGTSNMFLFAYSQAYTTSAYEVASGGAIIVTTVGGLSLGAVNASGTLRIYSGNALACTFGTTQAAAFTGAITATGLSTTGSVSAGTSGLTAANGAYGTGSATGNSVYIGRNSSGGGAAGNMTIVDKAGTEWIFWVDTVGKFRIGTGAPQEDGTPSDTSGTIVGIQPVVGRSTAQTAAVASVATVTVPAADTTVWVNANVNVTTATTHNFTVQVAYTDETNAARTLTLPVVQIAGTVITAITNVTGAGPYEGIGVQIRCKASTAVTIKTAGTFTTVTYNVEGSISQIG